MKKAITKTVSVCDQCGTDEHVYTHCLRCGKEYCFECRKVHGTEYQHGVNVSGSGDGYYCNECNAILMNTKEDPLFNAYQLIQQLKREASGFYREFKKRQDHAEETIKRLLQNSGRW